MLTANEKRSKRHVRKVRMMKRRVWFDLLARVLNVQLIIELAYENKLTVKYGSKNRTGVP